MSVTEASSERCFNGVGDVVSKKRSALNPRTVSVLVLAGLRARQQQSLQKKESQIAKIYNWGLFGEPAQDVKVSDNWEDEDDDDYDSNDEKEDADSADDDDDGSFASSEDYEEEEAEVVEVVVTCVGDDASENNNRFLVIGARPCCHMG